MQSQLLPGIMNENLHFAKYRAKVIPTHGEVLRNNLYHSYSDISDEHVLIVVF